MQISTKTATYVNIFGMHFRWFQQQLKAVKNSCVLIRIVLFPDVYFSLFSLFNDKLLK